MWKTKYDSSLTNVKSTLFVLEKKLMDKFF